jgi:hypothetical protein
MESFQNECEYRESPELLDLICRQVLGCVALSHFFGTLAGPGEIMKNLSELSPAKQCRVGIGSLTLN